MLQHTLAFKQLTNLVERQAAHEYISLFMVKNKLTIDHYHAACIRAAARLEIRTNFITGVVTDGY
jgi:hypothetical protein